ncbi:dynamin family protein [Acidithiobacillus sp.]|uniref:dynamin family protein n=1 Tax=Acidithiobacillus sp. TaxID=1872118 RepID=UPI0025C3D573|nr:dynamin family protein [Acidithiobacillus sp.]MCK9188612.1 dynamin family protein [Acidithiobacillus sp.]MCK9360528.1 dynamin family protein [Acidithiobacillus sp.]
MMKLPLLVEQLREYHQRRRNIAKAVHQMAQLSVELELLPSGTMLRMENLSQEIAHDQLRISFFGEFARGKSELINALFFSDLGARLMPSGPGQTTMCPVEIRHCHLAPSLQLLPIRSYTLSDSMEKLKRSRDLWSVSPLNSEDHNACTESMAQLTETLCVTLEEARGYGLCPPLKGAGNSGRISNCPSCGEGKVRISRWRYALLQWAHPVLEAGLVILDTPGLNSLGSEADLGLEAAREADALIFVLSADTGVTQSDLEIWEQLLGRRALQNQLVVLNKVDMLWDDLRDTDQEAAAILTQREITAQRLNLNLDQVVAASAQKGLLGRIRKDEALCARSGLDLLEKAIGEILIPGRRNAMLENAHRLLNRVVLDQRVLLDEQIQNLAGEIESMERLQAQTGEQLPRLLDRQQKLVRTFARDRDAFGVKEKEFIDSANTWLLQALSLERFDQIIESARAELLAAWTTVGIYDRFSQFFVETLVQFDAALERANRLSALMLDAYRVLEQQYGLPKLDTIPYAILPRRAELLAMMERYERFGKRLEIAATTQGAVVRKAFLSLANQVQDFVEETRRELQAWVKELLEMMNRQMDLYASQSMEKLEALGSIVESSANIQPRIRVLSEHRQKKTKQLETLNNAYAGFADLFQIDTENNLPQQCSIIPGHNPAG